MRYSDRHISDEELDQLFRDAHASEGQESLFVPEFWSEMEAMLPAEKKKKRGFYWIPVAATAIVFSIILFYPSKTPQVDILGENEKQHETGSNPDVKFTLNQNERQHEEVRTLKTQTVIAADLQSSSAKTSHKSVKTYFHAERSNHSNNARSDFKKDTEPAKILSVMDEPQILDAPSVQGSLSADLDSIRLEPRNERIIHEEIAALPKKTSNESNQWYLELGPTIGQSPYLSPGQKRNAVGGAVLGGGYTKRIDNAFVSFGLQARLEGFGGLEYRETNFSQNIVRTVSVKQLYSLEIPLKFGYVFRRSEFAFAVTPGVQLFIHGKERITENQVLQRENSFTGKVEHSNSLTMEFGFQYYYNFSSRFAVGAKFNADILRPFHTDYYLGKSAGLPVNGQIVLRTTISK
ncbi:MAG: hypothetical protein K0S23_1816 [Fluviicola sp.]|jgi:hypothetical protein|uniref:outer membrane beta-barrel protein n=1 Tax=Fluviicola sp. TaxID=1917219 RepID=UPI0026111214|nr:outer membrane beta-barrel protein [Fluviicola sp.]MDF3027509.1 hypothetical protein [Fluviicola sp.]